MYEEESIKEIQFVVKEKKGFTHTSMPFYLYHDNNSFAGNYDQKEIAKPHKQAVNDEELISMYIWENKPKPKPVVVMKEVKEKSRPVKPKEEEEVWEYTPMPMFMYHEETTFQGKEKPNIQKEPKRSPKKVKLESVATYIYKPVYEPEFVEPESSKKVVPVIVEKEIVKKEIVKQESVRETANDDVRPDKLGDAPISILQRPLFHLNKPAIEDVDLPSPILPPPPNLSIRHEPSETREDVTPVILIPATLREDSPEKPKKKEAPIKHNPDLMRSYKEKTQKIEKSRLTKLDDLDDDDHMFVPMQPFKKDAKECLCSMCVKNKSRIKKPTVKRKTPLLPVLDSDLETHQKNKLESRIHRLPKLNKPKKIEDPYKNRDKPRRSRPMISQPIIKPDFSVSYTKFLDRNLEKKEIKQKNHEARNQDYLESLGEDPKVRTKSKTSLEGGDNLDTYFENQRRR